MRDERNGGVFGYEGEASFPARGGREGRLTARRCCVGSRGAMTKSDAGYIQEARGARCCGGCSMYMVNGRCTLVSGNINRRGWCRHWVKK